MLLIPPIIVFFASMIARGIRAAHASWPKLWLAAIWFGPHNLKACDTDGVHLGGVSAI